MEQNGTDLAILELNAKQKKVAEMLANPEFTKNKSQIMGEIGVPRTTFYRWLRDKAFMSYVENLVDVYTDAELGEAWKALITEVKNGNVKAMKLYFELKGRYKKNIEIKAEVDNPLEGLSTDDLKKLIDDG